MERANNVMVTFDKCKKKKEKRRRRTTTTTKKEPLQMVHGVLAYTYNEMYTHAFCYICFAFVFDECVSSFCFVCHIVQYHIHLIWLRLVVFIPSSSFYVAALLSRSRSLHFEWKQSCAHITCIWCDTTKYK